MKLSEMVEKLTEKRKDGTKLYTQTSLGEAIGSNQSAVSQMLAGRAWDDHWEIFLKLLPIVMREDLMSERELLAMLPHDKRTNPSEPTAPKTSSGGRKRHG